MNQYVSEALSLSQKLADIGNPIDDKLLAVIILAGLPPEYKPMVMALDSSGVEITTDRVKNKLLQEEVKKRAEPELSEAAFTTKFDQKRFGKNFQRREIRCHGCNARGHVISQCRKMQQKPSVRTSQNVDNNYTKNKNWSLLTAQMAKSSEECWYIDSGATNHMTHNKEWVREFKKHDQQTITVANNTTLHTTGSGHVKIKLKGKL
ncbi:hypothetical protein KPH14_013034 [Odynerus spinipes]|uniref:Retrovirus-related Pol polyprotein from transposon TNT 1-94-like beta-barrel domain-containing protein n=1 Tax=Odynerus spinipes TaxID=1348599 RepID=A0AAD9R7X9_9HYME|nr:hypothetical protein KPH14_013034 [Odynerus spinipes]